MTIFGLPSRSFVCCLGTPIAALVIALIFPPLVCSERLTYPARERLRADTGRTRQAAAIPGNSSAQYDITIVKAYPHDAEAFTQGLVYSDGFLYESTGLYGRSSLRKIDLQTGAVLKIQTLSKDLFGEGLTLWKRKLIQLTWRSGIGFVYDRDSFLKVAEFHYDTEGWGITFDGKSLIMSDGSALLRFLDPESYGEQRRVKVLEGGTPIQNLNALEYIKGEIFANVWQKDAIVRISPVTGKVLGWIDLSALRYALGPVRNAEVLNGIAYDAANDRIFITGKLWPKLFEIKLIPR